MLFPMNLLQRDLEVLKNERAFLQSPALAPAKETIDPAEISNLSAYVFLGSQLSSYRMTGPKVTSSKLKNYDNLYAGIQVGGGIEKGVSDRWTVFGDLSYQKINNTSYYSEAMTYEKDKEVFGADGQCTYTMDYQVETPMGVQSRSISMDMTNVSINDQELIQNVSDIEHSLDVFSSSLGLRYRVLGNRKWGVNLFSAISGNYIVGIQEDMKTKIYYQTLMLMEKDAVNTSLKSVNRFYASVSGGIDLSYQLSDHFRLGVSGGYDHSLNSLRRTDVSGPKTYVSNVRSSLNLAYHF